MFPGESYDPVLSCWSSGSFSSDVRKVGGLTANHGLDTAAAAEALAAAHATRTIWLGAEKRWRICDVWNYPFATYTYVGIVGNQGSIQTVIEDWLAKLEVSDQGPCWRFWRVGIYCREFLEAMPPNARSVAVARYASWLQLTGDRRSARFFGQRGSEGAEHRRATGSHGKSCARRDIGSRRTSSFARRGSKKDAF